jgi:hypothetical protein
MWKYFNTVLKHPYHLASVALGVGLSVIFQSDILLLSWLLVDSSAVFFLATNPRMQRLIDAYAGADAERARLDEQSSLVENNTERILAGLCSQLPAPYRDQFNRMRGMYAEILKYIAGRKRAGVTPINITLARIHELLLMYFRLACYHATLLKLERPEAVQKRIDAKERALANERDPRVRSAIEASVDTLREQFALAEEKQSEARATGIRLDNMEEQMRVITSMTLTSDDVDAFDFKVSEIWGQLKSELDTNEIMSSLTTMQDLSKDPVGHSLVAPEEPPPSEQRQWPPPHVRDRRRQ